MPISKRCTFRTGLTLIELMVALSSAAVLIFAVTAAMTDSQKQWNRSYNRTTEGIAVQAQTAARYFEATARKATRSNCELGSGGSSITLFYYRDPSSSVEIDAYAEFYLDGGNLKVDTGDVDKETWQKQTLTSTVVLASNVVGCTFECEPLASMVLELDDGSSQLTVSASAIRRND